MNYFKFFVNIFLIFIFSQAAYGGRLALVIGNANYIEMPLKNPINDARAVATKLNGLDFKVTLVENLRKENIGATINAFVSSVKPGDDVVFFYAGHGQQIRGVNYLIAVNAVIKSEDDVPLNSMSLETITSRLNETSASVKIFFVDACRNNPFTRGFRSTERGLARMSGIPTGTLMHFSTRPGGVADDGPGSNSLYTSMLLKHIDSINTPVESVLKRVSTSVTVESRGTQEPWVEGNILGEFFFKTQSAPSTNEGTVSAARQSLNENKKPDAPIAQAITPTKVSDADMANAKLWAERSFEASRQSNWIEVIRTTSIALTFDPHSVNALINRCLAYISRSDTQEAMRDCQQALRLDPKNTLARNNIGLIQARNGEIDNALINYRSSCLGGFALACENFKKIKGFAPNDHEAIKQIMNAEANRFLDQGKFDEAIEASNKILKEYPTNAGAFITRSAAYANKGLTVDAIEDANRAIRIDPDISIAYNNRGYAQHLAGNIKSALIDYEIACSMKFELGCKNFKLLRGN